jgi:hypothetical protein
VSDDADRANADGADGAEDVPRLPRGRGLRLSRPQIVRIIGTMILLVFIVMMQRPCADAVSSFVTGFGDRGSGAAVMPRPDNVDLPAGSAASGSGSAQYEHLRPGMTDEEIKAAVERAKARAAGSGATP